MRALLGTYVEIAAWDLDEARLERAVGAAFAAVALVHRLMSVHSFDSDISKINRTAWRWPIEVHPWTAQTLRWAVLAHQATDGLFDCAMGHELGRWGVLAGCGFGQAEKGSLADVQVTRAGTVRLARRIGLDLGGIAKGYAVDRAIATLRQAGVRSAIANAGGDLRVMGDDAQPIYIRDPGDTGLARFAGMLSNGAIATSSAVTTTRTWRGRRVSALVRSRDRTPVIDANAYSVVAPRCVVADALTKVVAQTGRTAAPYLDRFGATVLVTSPRTAAT
jgi:thiamine biosynthesis lipoprotein